MLFQVDMCHCSVLEKTTTIKQIKYILTEIKVVKATFLTFIYFIFMF